MSSPTKNLAAISCIIGSVEIGGYGADGGITIAPAEADRLQVTTGADGFSTPSVNNNNDGVATITVMEHSLTYGLLVTLLEDQDDAQALGSTPSLPFQYTDPSNGDAISSNQSWFLNKPTVTGTKVAGTREFRIHLPGAYANRKAKFGAGLIA